MTRFLPCAALAAILFPVSTLAQTIDVISCLLEPARSYSIGAPVQGILSDVPVERGDIVSKGDVLLRIDARVEEAQLAAARFQATSEAIIESRKVQMAYATTLFEQAEELSERGVGTKNQLEELRAQKFIAEAQVREAEDARAAAQLQVASAEAALALREIRAPADAVVVARMADEGELAASGTPLLELVSIDRLHAEVLAPSSNYGAVALGQSWSVASENSIETRSGVVTAIDPVIDAASRSFGFRIELPNEDIALTAGNRCDLVQN